jgi:dTDP-4-dehydrorhamnose reductase
LGENSLGIRSKTGDEDVLNHENSNPMTKRILILGGAGMLGHKLCQLFRGKFETWCTVRSSPRGPEGFDIWEKTRTITGVDAADFDTVARAIADVKPEVVINCIGIIKQLKAAKDPIVSLSVNSLFPHRLAILCRAAGARMIHISTDCVFSGRKGMYAEDDVSDAEDLYGRTKYLGEVGYPGCLTIRTSIIGRELHSASGLIDWFLSNRGGKVRGFRKAIYTGFTTLALAKIIARIIIDHPELSGLWQISSDPINKYDLLKLVNEIYRAGIEIELDDAFFCDRSLNSARFRAAVNFQPPTWPEMIAEMHSDPLPYDSGRKS